MFVDRLLRGLLGVCAWSVILFLAAGRLDWTRGWFFVGIYCANLLATEIIVSVRNPQILGERAKRHKGTAGFDKVILPLVGVSFFLFPLVAGLDAGRFRISHIGLGFVVAALPVYALGCAVVAWTMIANKHLEPTVRIQNERGHAVVASGPYALVRHPMYAGILLQSIAAPLLLGSWWAYVAIAMTCTLFLVRTVLEDRFLREKLEGYEQYAKQTRFRLVPGLW